MKDKNKRIKVERINKSKKLSPTMMKAIKDAQALAKDKREVKDDGYININKYKNYGSYRGDSPLDD
tara:strand:+ start:276 stop:473 length:198 start_codon:yes stop_codon:yes gene_type:complete